MNTDKLIADTFNDRTSTLDLSPEKFEEMLEYIECKSQANDISYLSRFRVWLNIQKNTFHKKQFLQAAIAALIIICMPSIINNINFKGSSKSSSESPPSYNSGSYMEKEKSLENSTNEPTESKAEGSTSDKAADTASSRGKSFTTLVLTLKEFDQDDISHRNIQDLNHFFSLLESMNVAFVELNDVTINKMPIATVSGISGSFLIDGKSISLKDSLKIRVLANSDSLSAALDRSKDLSYAITVLSSE